jgi:hypothetical protein
MIIVASEEVCHGKEAHLVPAAQLTISSSNTHSDFVVGSTIIDKFYPTSVPQESDLRLNGVTLPSKVDSRN